MAYLEIIGLLVVVGMIGIGVFYFVRNYIGNNWPKDKK